MGLFLHPSAPDGQSPRSRTWQRQPTHGAVVICGEIMTMPGLPRRPAAETIRLNKAGQIEDLF